MRISVALLLIVLAACGGEAIQDNASTAQVDEARADSSLSPSAVPVRIGELGPSFPACNAVGTARRIDAGAPLRVRAAPFEAAEAKGEIPAGARFAICSRSIDQKWFGIVFDEAGAGDCGISLPVPRRVDYQGPCRSGWVSSAGVKLVAGESPSAVPPEAEDGGSG